MLRDRLPLLVKRLRPHDMYLQFDRLDPARGEDRMFVMKVAKDRQDAHRVEQYERDVKTQLIAAECAKMYNKQVCFESCAHTMQHAAYLCIFKTLFSVVVVLPFRFCLRFQPPPSPSYFLKRSCSSALTWSATPLMHSIATF